MRRPIALFALLFLLAAACGGGDDADTAGARRSPTPGGATATPEADDTGGESTPDPADDGANGAGSGGTTDGGDDGNDGEAPEPPPPAPEGQVNRPKTGTYIYDLEGTRTSPLNPAGSSYPDDATRRVDLSADGDITTAKVTNSEDSGSSTSRTRWEPNRALLLLTKIEQPGIEFSCTFEPPVEILHIPVKPETFPAQNWSSDNCEGTTKITVVGKEDVKDANGKTWSTWRIDQETDYTFESAQGTASGTVRSSTWLSPDLGTAIRSHETNDGQFENQTGTSSNVDSETTTTLKTHP